MKMFDEHLEVFTKRLGSDSHLDMAIQQHQQQTLEEGVSMGDTSAFHSLLKVMPLHEDSEV
jgi:hypothetical protein